MPRNLKVPKGIPSILNPKPIQSTPVLHYGSLTELMSKSDCAASPFPALPPLLAALPYEAVSSAHEQNMLSSENSVSCVLFQPHNGNYELEILGHSAIPPSHSTKKKIFF